MKRWVTLLLCMYAALIHARAPSREVVLYNWSEYMDPAILRDFESETGIHVTEIHYDSDEGKEELLALNGGAGMDVVLTSAVSLPGYALAGWIRPLDALEGDAAMLAWSERYPGVNARLGLPLLWGTVGIAYRRDQVAPPTSWLALFRPDPSLDGRIMLIDDMKDTFGLALKALGYSLNSVDPEQNQEAARLLERLKTHRPILDYPALNADNVLSRGRVTLAMVYNGDGLVLQQLDERLAFVVPEEGTNLWLDTVALLKAAPHPEDALVFIRYLARPDVAARLSRYTRCATANPEAEALLPENFRKNPLIYPPADIRARSEGFRPLPPAILRQRQAAFNRLRNP
ncbi:spermidine/putrescine ABC transporter substrate-binding protein [Hahella sp. SMD15-11]|uniref:Spermidine/putrescine ABC transporter substrate-binding protein n=1 Tax=Thermohahella caldifontis TaxID=3142973 RepID=A0AB39UY35_9GAMM